MKLGIIYAGQGSQAVGMGKDFYEANAVFKEIFDFLPEEKRTIAFNGPMEYLSDTRNTQPIMVAFALGVTKMLKAELEKMGEDIQGVAGLSLGEYSALGAASVFDEKTAIELVSLRGNAMAQAAKGIDCKMNAVLGIDRELLKACCEEALELGKVSIANYNCPGQIVIAGEEAAVEKASKLAIEKGAKRCVSLPVSGPFHTEFMKPAGNVLAEVFGKTHFAQMEVPVYFNVVGRKMNQGESISDLLVRQVSGSVYFEDIIRDMEADGIDTIIEVGPGKALSGFVRKTSKGVKVLNIENFEDFNKVISSLRELTGEK